MATSKRFVNHNSTIQPNGRFCTHEKSKCKPIKISDAVKVFMCISQYNSSISYDEAFNLSDPRSNDNLIAHITILNNIIKNLCIFKLKCSVSDDLRLFVVRNNSRRSKFREIRWNCNFIYEYVSWLHKNNKIVDILEIDQKFDNYGFKNILLHYYNTIYKIYRNHFINKDSTTLWNKLKDICKDAFHIFSINLTYYNDFRLQSELGRRSTQQKRQAMVLFNQSLSLIIKKELKKSNKEKMNNRKALDNFLTNIWRLDFNSVIAIKKSQNFQHKLYSIKIPTFEYFANHEDFPKKHSRYKEIKNEILLLLLRTNSEMYDIFNNYFNSNRGFKLKNNIS